MRAVFITCFDNPESIWEGARDVSIFARRFDTGFDFLGVSCASAETGACFG